MHDYILSCCSAADVTQEKLDAMDVRLLCNDFSMDGVPFKDDLGKTMTYGEFYDRIRAGEKGVTSQITPAEYIEYFTDLFEREGKDVLHVCLSSGCRACATGIHPNSVCVAWVSAQKSRCRCHPVRPWLQA